MSYLQIVLPKIPVVGMSHLKLLLKNHMQRHWTFRVVIQREFGTDDGG